MNNSLIINRKFWTFAILTLAVIGFGDLACSSFSLAPALSVHKDFTQEYLMAKAVLNGLDPYLPLPELGKLFPLHSNPELFPHPSAHPPVMAIVGLPFAFVAYKWAAGAWFVLEILMIALACCLLLKWWPAPDLALTSAVLTLTLFVWEPVFDEVNYGQLNSLQLILLIYAWLRFRGGGEISAGVFLGLAISIKLLSWPIVLFLLLRNNWRFAMAAGATTIIANIAALLVIGPGPFWRYYTTTSSKVLLVWRGHEANFSAWSLGWRLFEGTHGQGVAMNVIPPIYQSPVLASTVSVAVPVVLMVCSLWLALHMRNLDFSFSLMVCASILLSPVAWSHYLLLALLPVVIATRALAQGIASALDRWGLYSFSLVTGLLLFASGTTTRKLMILFETNQTSGPNSQIIHHIPFAAGLISLVPLLALLFLMWLFWLLDKEIAPERIDSAVQQTT